jgi:arylsulfatase A-like enzyme
VPTVARLVRRLVEIKRHPDRDWKKVSLQPVINLPFFESLYRRYRPDFATFHTNHVAHYQHRFMRAYQPNAYPDSTDPAEVARFGKAIQFGYETADWLLGRFLKLVGRYDDTILVVASSMGQQPYIPTKYGQVAPLTCRLKSIDALIDLLGIRGRCEYFSTMAPQWNLKIPDADIRRKVIASLLAARYVPVNKSMYSVTETDSTAVLTPISHHGVDETCRCSFPDLPGAPVVPFERLVVQADDTRKSGSHHPIGLLAFWGKSIRRGIEFGTVHNIDVAPTLLTLLGIPVPEYMAGRIFVDDVIAESRATPLAAVSS